MVVVLESETLILAACVVLATKNIFVARTSQTSYHGTKNFYVYSYSCNKINLNYLYKVEYCY